MRRILFGLGLTSALVLLSGFDKQLPEGPVGFGSGDDPSACDLVTGNLVMNCGFDPTGMFPPWVQSGDLSATAIDAFSAHTGTYGLDAGPVTNLGFITQNIATGDGGAMHHLSFWLANVGGTPNRFQLSWEGNIIMDERDMPPFDYRRYDFDVFACGNTSELKFGFYQAPTYFHFDDVVLVRSTD